MLSLHQVAIAALTLLCAAVPGDLPRDGKPVKALEAWLKLYRAGKIDLLSKTDIARDSMAMKFELLGKGFVGQLTAERELELLTTEVAKIDDAEAAMVLIDTATAGLDGGIEYTRAMAPALVRNQAERALASLASTAAKDQVLKVGRGDDKLPKAMAAAGRAAALRALGRFNEPTFRVTIEQGLTAPEAPVRIGAAEGLELLGDEKSLEALAGALERETVDTVIVGLIASMRAVLQRKINGEPKPAADAGAEVKPDDKPAPFSKPPVIELPESARLCVRSAAGALGRTTWRADITLLDFMRDFRTADAVPALIDLLQRFKDQPQEVQSGRLSGLLLHRAHETLVTMVGAIIPADQPEKWREFWAQEKDKVTIKQAGEEQAAADKGGTAASGLFGIPVQGSRVVFLVDLSGSMMQPMPARDGGTGARRDAAGAGTRLAAAKVELRKAIQAMTDRSQFTIITYNGLPKARAWQKDMQQATERNKERALRFVEQMEAEGGTNMWAGLETSLKIKSLVYGNRYDSSVDELFVISDGAPSVGEVVDPSEILQLVNATNKFSKVRINSIFITSPSDVNPRGQSLTPSQLMRRIAEENGGKFVLIGKVADQER